MFPESKHQPTLLDKGTFCLDIALRVATKLVGPPVSVGTRKSSMLGTAMPEATVEKHRNPGPGEGDVDGPPSCARDWVIHSIAHATRMEESSDGQLRLGVTAPRHAHPTADSGTRCSRNGTNQSHVRTLRQVPALKPSGHGGRHKALARLAHIYAGQL